MAGPVSGFTYNNHQINAQQQPHQPAGSAQTSSSQSTPSQPGTGVGYVHGQSVQMTAMNQTGFTSAFSTPRTASLAQRRHMPINPRYAESVLSQKQRLAEEARNTMQAISQLDLNHHPALNQNIKNLSKAHMQSVAADKRSDVVDAITDYQAAHGDFFLMNVSVTGYQSLQQFLKSRSHEFNDEEKVDEFIEEFACRYGALVGIDDEEEELDELKDRLEGRLAEPAKLLKDFLSAGPDISNVPLLKGASGGDNPVTTQLNGKDVLQAVLNGKALNFNSFLSTTTGYNTALEFCGKMPQEGLGNPLYTVDLTKNSEESEILRRDALRELANDKLETGSLLFYFKTQNSTGVNIAAAQELVDPEANNHMNSEDEVLLAPGHYFQPEQIVRNEDGVALIGTLHNGNHRRL